MDGHGRPGGPETGAARELLAALADLVLPSECAGCAGRGSGVEAGLCPRCRRILGGPVRRAEAGAPRLNPADAGPPLPVWAGGTYDGVVREAIIAWKRRGRSELGGPFVDRMEQVGAASAGAVAPFLAAAPAGVIGLVPIPSRAAARLRRGESLVEGLARGAALGLLERGVPARCCPILRRAPGARDQAGRGSRARSQGRQDATVVRGGRPPPLVVLIDDVMTTGASLLDAERALTAAGSAVLAALVLAATPPPAREVAGPPSARHR